MNSFLSYLIQSPLNCTVWHRCKWFWPFGVTGHEKGKIVAHFILRSSWEIKRKIGNVGTFSSDELHISILFLLIIIQGGTPVLWKSSANIFLHADVSEQISLKFGIFKVSVNIMVLYQFEWPWPQVKITEAQECQNCFTDFLTKVSSGFRHHCVCVLRHAYLMNLVFSLFYPYAIQMR